MCPTARSTSYSRIGAYSPIKWNFSRNTFRPKAGSGSVSSDARDSSDRHSTFVAAHFQGQRSHLLGSQLVPGRLLEHDPGDRTIDQNKNYLDVKQGCDYRVVGPFTEKKKEPFKRRQRGIGQGKDRLERWKQHDNDQV